MSSTRVKNLSPKFLDEKLKPEKDYWLAKLSGDLMVTGIPLDYPRPAEYTVEKKNVDISIAPETQRDLFKLCNNNESLVLTLLTTALKICLYKYTSIENVIVGTAIHKRYSEVASLNTVLALRDDVTGTMTVKELLLQVKDTLSGAYANEKYPFERILDLLKIESPSNREPLFNIAIILDNIGSTETLTELKVDAALIFFSAAQQLTGHIRYNPALFKEATIKVFEQHYAEILKRVLAQPEMTISKVELLSEDERLELLFVFNNTETDYPRQETIHRLMEAQVCRTPSQTALVCRGHSLTYRELNAKANQVARFLRSVGVEAGARVGIFMEHSLEMVIGLFGVLKAGATYLPLEPAYPKARLRFLIEDAQASIVLTTSALVDKLPDVTARICSLGESNKLVDQQSTKNLKDWATTQDVAYVIYTSGSTGEPKGVEIKHSSLVNYIWWARDIYLGDDQLDFPLYSSLAFDLTVTSIFLPLITGNKIFIYPNDETENPILAVLRDDQVGVLKLTPSHLSLIKDTVDKAHRIKRIIVGGEAFETRLTQQIRETFGANVEIFNEYGPTEGTVGCMIHQFNSEQDNRAFVPIGEPIANTQIYVLDQDLKPVAINILGDLYISGEGLARGYLNKPELTAGSFVKHPFIWNQKMYKTGDLARWLPEGILEYAGRKDAQIKFHGYRIELNEISSVLNQHTEIEDSVIVVTPDTNGNSVMLAYYVAPHEFEMSELRAFMLEKVIEETVPNFFVHTEQIPLTVNGKIDYRALPTLEQIRQTVKRAFVGPRNLTEEVLAGIWAGVLGLEQVGIHDDFFQLGGHSLIAGQIVSRARKAFQIDLPLRTLFEAPTVAGLSVVIETAQHERMGLPAPLSFPRVSRDEPLPVSLAQQRLWFLDRMQPGTVAYNIFPSFRLRGVLNVKALEQSLNEIIRRHESFRTIFTSTEGQPMQVIVPALTLEVSVTDLRQLPEPERAAEVKRLTTEEANRSFDLHTGPLIRSLLLRLDEEEHLLIMAMHHITSDGWSMGIFYRELAAHYQAFSSGTTATLPELPVQYADYAVWQRNWLQGDVLKKQLSYWKQQLANAPAVMDLKTSRGRAALASSEGGHKGLMLSRDVSDALKVLSRSEGVTLFMTLLAAFNTWLYYYVDRDDIIVGSDVANRNRTEIEGLIGFFVNTLVLRTSLSGNPTFRELLGRVREVCLAAYVHQDLPFEKIVEEINPERQLNRNPLFQVMFGLLQEDSRRALELSGLAIQPLGVDNSTSVFDLSLYMIDDERGLAGAVRFNANLFDVATITGMLSNFEVLVRDVAATPDIRLDDLKKNLMTADRELQLLKAEDLKQARLQKFKNIKRYPLDVQTTEQLERI
jgi:amino acid adenylation domain-containing protein